MEPKTIEQPEIQPSQLNAEIVHKTSFGNLFTRKIILIIAGVVMVAILVVLLLVQRYNRTVSALMFADKAANAYKNADFTNLKKNLLDASKVTKNDPKILAALIKSYASEGNQNGTEDKAFKTAEPYVKQALDLKPQNAEVLIAVGYLYETNGKYQDALGYYNKGLELDAKNSQGYFHKGHVLEFLNDSAQARQSYEKAYSLDQNDPLIVMSIAKYKLFDGLTDDALLLYKRASKLESANADQKAEALTNASIITRGNLSQIGDALKLSEEATKESPSYSPALGNHGYNLALSGDSTQAIAYMQKAIAANPRISQNYWYLGLIYRATKNYPASISMQEQGLAKFENDNTVLGSNRQKTKGLMLYNLAQTYSKNNNLDKVVPTLQLALDQNADLKEKLKKDTQSYGDFKEVSERTDFKKLIQ